MENKNFLVIGGDERQTYLAEALKAKKLDVTFIGQEEAAVLEELKRSRIVLMPIAAKGKIVDAADQYAHKGQTIYGSVFPEQFRKVCKEKEAKLVDYMKDDTVAIQNAVATAEGTIAEAIVHSPVNLHGSRCLVLGFGRCGEILADKLKGLKCDVTVMARNEKALAKAEAYGYHSLSFAGKKKQESYDFIFNTIPAMVADRSFLERQSPGVIIIDIASAPGGVDLKACRELGIDARSCPGLPAKYAPKTSAKILANVIDRQKISGEGSRGE